MMGYFLFVIFLLSQNWTYMTAEKNVPVGTKEKERTNYKTISEMCSLEPFFKKHNPCESEHIRSYCLEPTKNKIKKCFHMPFNPAFNSSDMPNILEKQGINCTNLSYPKNGTIRLLLLCRYFPVNTCPGENTSNLLSCDEFRKTPLVNPESHNNTAMNTEPLKNPVMNPEPRKNPVMNNESHKNPVMNNESRNNPVTNPEFLMNPATNPESLKSPVMNNESSKNPVMNNESRKNPVTTPDSFKNPLMNHEFRQKRQEQSVPQLDSDGYYASCENCTVTLSMTLDEENNEMPQIEISSKPLEEETGKNKKNKQSRKEKKT